MGLSTPSTDRLALAVPPQSTVQRIRSNDSEHFPALPPVAFGFLPSTNETTTRIIFNPNTYQSIFFALNVFGNAQLGRRNAIDFSLESLPGVSVWDCSGKGNCQRRYAPLRLNSVPNDRLK
ncbi:hypothetical protein QR680_018380 [Steinernema hermaphroditum]|uniref:Uncharacterized protein n=1 Tax=Steinernema hermaphroditum TaxID=289476 RepID=A0AA39HHS6_9BILA|nr:hypothetical protein QR680_018380 [Steinernema hermaphroditum]